MFVKSLFLLCSITLVLQSCDDPFFPVGLYDYQVEKLLTNDSNKLWTQIEQQSSDCQDSTWLLIGSNQDSISLSRIVKIENCEIFDTIFFGNAKISFLPETFLSTDTLIFDDSNKWIIEEITFRELVLNINENRGKYYYFE